MLQRGEKEGLYMLRTLNIAFLNVVYCDMQGA